MDKNALFVVVLLALIVVGVNGMLIFFMRKGKPNQHFRLWQRAVTSARNPWKEEEKQLGELAEMVKGLKEKEEEGKASNGQMGEDGPSER